MSRVSSASFISCESGTGRPLENAKAASYFLGFVTNRLRTSDGLRRNDELDDEYKTCGVAGFGWGADGAAVRRTGKGNGAGWVERCAKRRANSGGCDEVAREQEIQGCKGVGEERRGDSDGYRGCLQREPGSGYP